MLLTGLALRVLYLLKKKLFILTTTGLRASQVALMVKNLPAYAGNVRRGFAP